jgi:hypothetical protein
MYVMSTIAGSQHSDFTKQSFTTLNMQKQTLGMSLHDLAPYYNLYSELQQFASYTHEIKIKYKFNALHYKKASTKLHVNFKKQR